jgi:L-lactate utilization protein LutB
VALIVVSETRIAKRLKSFNSMDKRKREWDAFISHAVEDQETFVRNLAAMLTRLGLSMWYAETAHRAESAVVHGFQRAMTAGG